MAAVTEVVGIGFVWHFVELVGSDKSSSSSGFRGMPWTTGRSSGLTLGAAF